MNLNWKIEKELIFEILLFCGGITSICLFFRSNLMLFALLLLGWAIGITFWHREHEIVYFLVGALIGPIGEIVCIRYGVWEYSNPSFLGIPMWLPLAWGLATMLIKRISETIVETEE